MHQSNAKNALNPKAGIANPMWTPLVRVCANLLPFLLVACLAVTSASTSIAIADEKAEKEDALAAAQATLAALPEITLRDDRAQLMYEVMIAELAGRRGIMDIAAEGYLRASRRTDDVRIADRATKLAVWSRDWATAELAVKRWLELDNSATEPNELYAQILLRSNRPDEAAEQFAKIVRLHETPELMMSEVSLLLVREPEQPRAKQTMLKLQAAFPNLVESHLGVARFSLQVEDTTEALLAVAKALQVDPLHGESLLLQSQILLAQGQVVHNLPQLALAVQNDPNNLSLRMGYARLLINLQQNDDALVELETLFSQAPSNPNVLLTIGLLALDLEQTDAAQKYLEALLSTGEQSDQAHFYLARIYDQKKDYSAAISQYEAVSEGDLYISSRMRAAELYAFSGQLNTGLERLRSLSRRVSDPTTQASIVASESRMLMFVGQKRHAYTVLTEGLQAHPENGELLYARALAAEGIGEIDVLQRDLQKLIALQPNNASALNALGYFLADQNIKLDEAEVYLEKAIALRPNDAAIMDSIGWLRFRQGRYDEALVLLRDAYELFPDGEIAAHLGEVLWAKGEIEKARTVWSGGLAKAPDDEKILETQTRLDR